MAASAKAVTLAFFFKFEFYFLYAVIGIFGQAAFPYAYNIPAQLSETAGNSLIPVLGTLYLVSPCLRVRLWRNVFAAVMAVPKASIDKNGNLQVQPYEIRPAGERLMPAPTG